MQREQELPLGIGGAAPARVPAILIVNGNGAERRRVLVGRKCAGARADQEDHGVAVLDVRGELFKRGAGPVP